MILWPGGNCSSVTFKLEPMFIINVVMDRRKVVSAKLLRPSLLSVPPLLPSLLFLLPLVYCTDKTWTKRWYISSYSCPFVVWCVYTIGRGGLRHTHKHRGKQVDAVGKR